jgi:SAM-dependent methyltransferase
MSQRPERAAIDVATMRGLEIGPLASPRISKSEGRVLYLDHASTDDLRAKYLTNQSLAPLANQIVDVDIVQTPGTRLVDAIGAEPPFDYVIASHIIEHVPDVIEWLAEIERVLSPGGVVSLVIPDKRYTFDVNRTLTVIADLVDAHLRRAQVPTFRQMYDFFAGVTTIDGSVDTAALWAGTVSYDGVVRSDVDDVDVNAYGICADQQDKHEYVDVHAHVFTPDSFLDLYRRLVRMQLVGYEIAAFTPTAPNTLEFYVTLKRCSTPPGAARIARQLASVPQLVEPVPVPPSPPEDPSPSGVPGQRLMPVSDLEHRALLAKRWAVGGVRRARQRRSSRA